MTREEKLKAIEEMSFEEMMGAVFGCGPKAKKNAIPWCIDEDKVNALFDSMKEK